MRKKTHKKFRESKRRSRKRGGKDDWVDKHSDVGLATFDVFLGGNNDDEVKDLDVAMGEFDLFDENDSRRVQNTSGQDQNTSAQDQNTSGQEDFGNMSMISGESEEPANLNESLTVFDDDDEIVPENSIPFDEDDWMNLDEGFMDTNTNDENDDSYLNETTNESISFGGTKKRRKMRKRKTSKKRKLTRKLKKRKYKRKTRKHIKRIKLGGNVDLLGSVDFNPNLAFDKKQMGGKWGRKKGGQNIGGNCTDPNFSIYNTPMLKLFPYRP